MRLTKRKKVYPTSDNNGNLTKVECIEIKDKGLAEQKLCQLEDIEEELNIELITLFEALKNGAWFIDYRDSHIFYAKATIPSFFNSSTYDSPQENIEFKGFKILDQLYGIGHELKDYGKTWALTKEELL